MQKGIDVSVLQGAVDWKRVRASGVRFAMIKATQGHGLGATTSHLRLFTDSRFYDNLREATNAGLLCGAYHYMTAVTEEEARDEADYFAEVIARAPVSLRLWAAVDVEDVSPPRYSGKLSREDLTLVTRAFISRLKAAGLRPMLYTNPNYLEYKFTSPDAFSNVDIWLAHYGVDSPRETDNLKIWQYSSSGRIDGISSEVDLNMGYFSPDAESDIDAIIRVCGFMSMWKDRMHIFASEYEFGDEFWRRIADELR